jgi:hypothetical protein
VREYAKVAPQFWTGKTGRAMRGDHELQVLCAYLITAPGANMAGVYYLPLPTAAHETGLSLKALDKALRRASEGAFAYYDMASETVWVPEMARFQVGDSMKPEDKRIAGLISLLENVPNSPFIKDFYARYREAYHLPEQGPWKGLRRAFEGTREALRSQETEQEQEKEQEKETEQEPPPPSAPEGSGEGGRAAGPSSPVGSLSSPAQLAVKFVQVFNAAFERRLGMTPGVEERIGVHLAAHYKRWQILALPILNRSWPCDQDWLRDASPEILLRDGKRPRTTRDGYTAGAVHHLERELQRIDKAVLDERLARIAQEAGVLDYLRRMGVKAPDLEPRAAVPA